ncbi:cell wall lytic activity [Paenibacillus sp. S3N08]|uniref:Cell wall lytic activity n=2 Tax=Paenibacillus agricola TaxID=2716264 RepID=A0ABX0JH43_9BACL|nr:cell wall lytic activity [Paenibacillus agricola]
MKLYLLIAFFTLSLFSLLQTQEVHAAATIGVRIQINDSVVAFPEGTPQPFIERGSGNLYVPLKYLSEQLGFQANQLPLFKNANSGLSPESEHVPLRLIADSLGYRVQWDVTNRVAIIGVDGAYHAPAWYAPKPQSSVLQTAFNYLGVPYVWGGSSPKGFDCSGYVGYIFQQSGIKLPRTSVEMYDSVGTRVNELQEGDLVFFAEGSRTSHVGIYLGNEQFISATSSGGVSVESITTGYWGRKFVGAKRLT